MLRYQDQDLKYYSIEALYKLFFEEKEARYHREIQRQLAQMRQPHEARWL